MIVQLFIGEKYQSSHTSIITMWPLISFLGLGVVLFNGGSSVRLIFVLLALSFVFSSEAKLSEKNLLNELAKAEDYLKVKPSVSTTILNKYLQQIHLLDEQTQMRWLQALLRASISLNDLAQVESSA